jgi:hypothetical protein
LTVKDLEPIICFSFSIFSKNKIPPKKAESFSQFLVIENLSQGWDSDLYSENPGPQHYTVQSKTTVILRRAQIINLNVTHVNVSIFRPCGLSRTFSLVLETSKTSSGLSRTGPWTSGTSSSLVLCRPWTPNVRLCLEML